ncbi:hypothetical protein COW94_02440 [Candidatus Peregrinibacteria bacterium CG22_combo_CG10-13_8_21_14_all_44_10]|nr:MAG: hypothetical protein AUK45_02155 [Candidatus Peregrinibacteria bacterium CG2_30_44_17]PIP66322.1 MAG: hypothetical protein COW94_02440 [Candidatus Peregrinibacteria bacterium CG22_combo_CG10-13_8_21_14_all_44_10]PIS04019.1 MAG: hypothetical protein COT83_02965 [Candidatus Peregrinibacteria bacterium CG10_big_fil_rev_8_21_14_0_10_44_7]PIX79237.1 MAG: hypothetical protein COZ35_03755 [Candidatus Peregrinibacteria bacterium CG_4_10_14_3_um_filter_44_21]PJB88442.1 MAG: hypothetical protein 
MRIPYKNPDKLIDRVISDLNLDLNAKQKSQLREDLSDIYCARLYLMMNTLAGDKELPLDDRTEFLKFVTYMPDIEDDLKFEAEVFYEDMIRTYQLVDSYKKHVKAA